MSNVALEEFARALVRRVRDEAIRSCDGQLQPDAASPFARRWKDLGVDAAAIEMLVPDIVDETVFHLLRAIDEGILPLTFASANGQSVALSVEGEGELGGDYMMSAGWREQFSEERFVDDFADLADFFDAKS